MSLGMRPIVPAISQNVLILRRQYFHKPKDSGLCHPLWVKSGHETKQIPVASFPGAPILGMRPKYLVPETFLMNSIDPNSVQSAGRVDKLTATPHGKGEQH